MMMSIELAEDILTSYPSQGSSPWKHNYFDCDMAFPTNMRKAGIFMFVTNEVCLGSVKHESLLYNKIRKKLKGVYIRQTISFELEMLWI